MSFNLDAVRITGGIGADDMYWQGLASGVLRLPRCLDCGRWMWPAHHRCGTCGSWECEWIEREMRGVVYAWTRSWYAFERVRERADDLPYVTALVEIADAGNARVLGVLEGGEDALRVGVPVLGRILPPAAKSKGYPSIVWRVDHSPALNSKVTA